jgi:class 3 adenylate cyclase
MAGTEGERRVVAVLMADIAGSTAIGEALGPERSKYLFDEVMRLVAAEVERYDGTVAQLAGDGLLAVFGAPVAHEDDSERAVRAGLAVQRALGRYGADVREAYDIDIRARIAVNTGPVVIAPGDGDARGRYNALGDTVNVTARLQSIAAEGDVVLGPQTAVQVRSSFELEELGPTSLRGRSEPIDRYRVLGETEPGPTAQEGALVGRDAELAEVRDALDRLDARCAALMTQESVAPGEVTRRYFADVCYAGQAYHLEVPFMPEAPDPFTALTTAFYAAHDRTYGFAPTAPVRLVNLRAVHRVAAAAPPAQAWVPNGHAPLRRRARILLPEHKAPVEAAVYDRAALKPDDTLVGPAIVEQDDTTTLVTPGWRGRVDRLGNLVLQRGNN